MSFKFSLICLFIPLCLSGFFSFPFHCPFSLRNQLVFNVDTMRSSGPGRGEQTAVPGRAASSLPQLPMRFLLTTCTWSMTSSGFGTAKPSHVWDTRPLSGWNSQSRWQGMEEHGHRKGQEHMAKAGKLWRVWGDRKCLSRSTGLREELVMLTRRLLQFFIFLLQMGQDVRKSPSPTTGGKESKGWRREVVR